MNPGNSNTIETICRSDEETFELGENLGKALKGGEVILLEGTLGAGKTLLTKGIVNSLGFDFDDVTSPSYTLVNLYETRECNVFHIDLWRIEDSTDAATAVGLDEILEDENAIVIIEWAENLADTDLRRKTVSVKISGDGDDPRSVFINYS